MSLRSAACLALAERPSECLPPLSSSEQLATSSSEQLTEQMTGQAEEAVFRVMWVSGRGSRYTGADPGGGGGSWGSGPGLLGDPQTSKRGKKRCACARENAAF